MGGLSHYLLGNRIGLYTDPPFSLVDPYTGVETPTDPTTVTFTVITSADRQEPLESGGTRTDYVWPGAAEITHPGVGKFVCEFDIDDAFFYNCAVQGEGACKARAETAFEVDTGRVPVTP